jgi:hypothetical protein
LTTVEVLGPKGPVRHGGVDVATWARRQLEVAGEIVDNPGGGLLFATQTMGQVKAALADADAARWGELVRLLDEAEDAAVRRRYGEARGLLDRALEKL